VWPTGSADRKYGGGLSYDDIDLHALADAADVCNGTVALAAGGTEKRYTCDGVLQSDQLFGENLDPLLSAMHGSAILVGGKWTINAAAWVEPTLVLDESDFRAVFSINTGLGNDQAFNAIKGKFCNPDKLWQPDDFPAIISSAYEVEDGGDGQGLSREFKDVDLECTLSPSMAQRIARIDLRESRQPISFTAPVKIKGLQLRAGNTVAIANAMFGWTEKAFRVEKLRLVLGFAPGKSASNSQPGIIRRRPGPA
jgi:hypothetical protein